MLSWLRVGFVVVALAASGGCSPLDYYAQSIRGQLELLSSSRSIESIIADPGAENVLKQRLRQVLAARAFATHHLSLPDNKSYTRYADLGRRFVVWNVFAAPELSVVPREWCFPVVGCVIYRGYFRQDAAERFAAQLQRRGDDVYVTGIAAYSTLGWFNDPVLNTMVHYQDTQLAGLIFHELAHQLVYAKGDTVFNESFATAVELEGVKRWLAYTGVDSDSYTRVKRHEGKIIDLISDYRARLQTMYAESLTDQQKQHRKREIFAELKARYAQLRDKHPTRGQGMDAWFAQDLNNAHLASVGAYNELVPEFQRLLERHAGDLERFYQTVAVIAKLPVDQRQRRLRDE